MFFNKPIYEFAGDADFARNLGQVISRKPTGIFDLRIIEGEFSPCVSGREADHERMGERPGLTVKIFDLFYVDTYFLLHLTNDSLFQ